MDSAELRMGFRRLAFGAWHGYFGRTMLKLIRQLRLLAVAIAPMLVAPWCFAGGGPLNTLVVVNADSTNSLELGNYYREQRDIPPQNVLRINWPGGNISWTLEQFQTTLAQPLQAALAQRQLSNQIHFVVLSMDIPFQVISGNAVNSTTAALFYGFKGATDMKNAGNPYAFSETAFDLSRSSLRVNWLATMLTGATLSQARAIIDRGVAADATFPTQPIVLAKTADPLRNLRHRAFDSTMFTASIDGHDMFVRTNSTAFPTERPLLGWQTGLTVFSAPPNSFVPGAIADSMTSFGGIIFGPNSQTTLLELLRAGATASYGTVAEPSADAAKFPDPMVYVYQARGFNIAESYYQSIAVPYLGLIVGDPLAAPFARPAAARWVGLASGQVLSGNVSFGLEFESEPARPIHQVDLFIDGQFFYTLTNVAPVVGNQLTAFMQGRHMNHTVLANESVASIATAFASRVNQPSNTNLTGIRAAAIGDRVVLTRFTTNVPARPSAPTNLRSPDAATSSSANDGGTLSFASHAGAAGVATTFLKPSATHFVNSAARGMRTFAISGTPDNGGWLKLTVPRGDATVIVATTNSGGATTALALANALAAAINTTPELQETNGVFVEDVVAGWFGSASLTLRSRQPGFEASSTRVAISGSPSLSISPAEESSLNQNLTDLLPRHHVYVTTGVSNLVFTVSLDTAMLTDGYHELTAVAYEGTHVRTQTRITVPVEVRNTDFRATLAFSATTNVVPVSGIFQLAVNASAPAAGVVLTATGGTYGTAGPFASPVNPAPAVFQVSGSTFGVGSHPFHAIVTSANGARFRTPPLWIRFTPE